MQRQSTSRLKTVIFMVARIANSLNQSNSMSRDSRIGVSTTEAAQEGVSELTIAMHNAHHEKYLNKPRKAKLKNIAGYERHDVSQSSKHS
jgi:hypothetical protein